MICLVKIFYFVVNIFNIVFLFNQLQGLNQLLDSNSITLIDVRNRTELNTVGQIPGSFCLPLHEVGDAMELSSEEFFAKYKFVKPSPDDRKIVLTCRSGRRVLVRSVTSFQIDHGNFLSYFVIQIIRNTFCHCCVFRSKIKSS
jgi:rhodanese-related sulfurtransferase